MKRLLSLLALAACTFEPPLAIAPQDSGVLEKPERDATVGDAGDPSDADGADGADGAELSRDAEPEDVERADAEPDDSEPMDGEQQDSEPEDAEQHDSEPRDAEPAEASTPACGNGFLEGNEGCDDGDSDLDDGCNSACDVELGWSCDAVQPSGCDPICGDGLVRGGETCDDDDVAAGDGCGSDCRAEPSFYCEGEPSACTPWWDPAYSRRRSITVDRAGIGERLVFFPVLVVLSPQRIDYAAAAPDAIDLRFVADDQTTVLPHEIEEWSPNGLSFVWVRLPAIDPAGPPDPIWMYYDGPSVGSSITPDQVWSAGYEAVWHLAETPTGLPDEILDSSGSLHEGTTVGGMNAGARVASFLGFALQFDGVDDRIDFGAIDPSGWSSISFEAWVQWTGSSDHVLSISSGLQPQDHIFSLETPGGDSVRARLSTAGNGAGNSEVESPAGSLAASKWQHLAASWSASDRRLAVFIDGVARGSITREGDAVLGSLDPAVVGERVEATIDEVRISNVARSDEWIEAQHRSMIDRLLVHGSEQQLP